MKIAVCSDIHLEFGPIELTNNENADVLVLAGDICVSNRLGDRDLYNLMGENTQSERFHAFFRTCSENFPHVIYVMGNHEHYDGDFAISVTNLKTKLAYLKNLHVLDKETIVLNEVTFIGGTLWTDMNKEDPITIRSMSGMMNDFRCVSNSNKKVSYKTTDFKYNEDGTLAKDENGDLIIVGSKFHERDSLFSPMDAVEDHKLMLEFIKSEVDGKDQKFVVVGHHAPLKLSTHPRYADEVIMNGGYSSDLSEFILDRPQIKLWFHGHTHEPFDYMMGETRIVCNPRGYDRYEQRAVDFKLMTVEV